MTMVVIRELVCIPACCRVCPRSCGLYGGSGRRRVSPRRLWARWAPRPPSGRPSPPSPRPPAPPRGPRSASGAACGEAGTGGWAGRSGSAEPRASSAEKRDPGHVQNLIMIVKIQWGRMIMCHIVLHQWAKCLLNIFRGEICKDYKGTKYGYGVEKTKQI